MAFGQVYRLPFFVKQDALSGLQARQLMRHMVQMKYKVGVLLLKAGVSDSEQKLHKTSYFREPLYG